MLSAETPAGRFAPSPTSRLHVGNLRTALLAWLFARSSGRRFVLRIEDLDQQRVAAAGRIAAGQIGDLHALGLDFDGKVWVQSNRAAAYAGELERLRTLTYECFCTRREIAAAAQAPHDGFRPYPGTCRDLSSSERAGRRAMRPPALRVRAGGVAQTIRDVLHGEVTLPVDDFVLVRNDGVFAYNFAVVVDDAAAGVDQVVRGDDLLSSAPRQAWLAEQLGHRAPEYAHVPLALGPDGKRLAKRDGAVTLPDLAAVGVGPNEVLSLLAASLGLAEADEPVTPNLLAMRFDPAGVPVTPWVVDPHLIARAAARPR